MGNPLRELRALGQSIWYDDLSRELCRSGGLARLIEEDGVTGVTSNPSIFDRVMSSERGYDADLHALVDEGFDEEEIYERLVIADIRAAGELLRPVYEKSDGQEGYVSLEVSPNVAYDTESTKTEVRRLFEQVACKNVMIKVPATPQGIEAIPELIASGININVTLIFSPKQYRSAAMAYLEGLERRISMGEDPSQVTSVASFFVSRVDTMVDEWLKDLSDPNARADAKDLTGKAAIANAKIAYSMFKEIFESDVFEALRGRGAKPQRIVWASTSTKNPAYPDTLYVESLIGAQTINTMPALTLAAYRDHGKPAPRLDEGPDEAREFFQKLDKMGIVIEDVMELLLENGVKVFSDAFDSLLQGVRTKRTRLLRGWGHRSASLGDLQQEVDGAFVKLDEQKLSESLWKGDTRIWTDDPKAEREIAQRLGWLQIVETMVAEKPRLREFAEEIRSSGFTCAVLLGMGGSSLAAEVFRSCFGSAPGYLDLKVLDTTVPETILKLDKQLDYKRTLFIVASKSGGTIEVVSLYKFFRARTEQELGSGAGANFIAITDPGTSLGKLASEQGFRRVFLNPSDIGGRFSALSYFGLVPIVLIGADLDRFLMRASQAVEASGPEVPSLESPGAWLGVIMALASQAGKNKLTMVMSRAIASFGCWVEQLIAESTGKEGKGILPVDGEHLGEPENYGADRLFLYFRLDDDPTNDIKISALEKAGHAVVTLRLHGPYDIGREIFRLEFATAVTGAILRINPFDQPNVQESKNITKAFLQGYVQEGKQPPHEELDIADPGLFKILRLFFDGTPPGTYVALNAFMSPTPDNSLILGQIRWLLRNRFMIATAVGFGPRYLHSTGQFHKGGTDQGRFIVIAVDDAEDIAIPGEKYSFGALKTAQFLGDCEALKNRGKKILKVRLSSDSQLEDLLRIVRSL